jgi:hypothetical protein
MRGSVALAPYEVPEDQEGRMGQDVDAAREAFGSVPPKKPVARAQEPDPAAGGSGPHAPGPAEPASDEAPESGGYDTRPPASQPDNRKGGYGAG